MNRYFYIDSEGKQKGTFSPDELRGEHIKRETLVWTQGMEQWTRADEVDELRPLFGESAYAQELPQTPQTLQAAPAQATPTATDTSSLQPMPKTWLLESILATIFCCLPFGIAGIIFASKVESTYHRGNYDEALRLSREARKWTKVSFWLAIGLFVLYIILIIVLAVAGLWAGDLFESFSNLEY